jgi:predicted RecA/RadA family phage recombinase
METSSPGFKKWLWLHTQDNVAVALCDFSKGDSVEIAGHEVVLKNSIDYGHKFAVKDIHKGEPIIKYAETIGVAGTEIPAGEHVHVHNVQSLRARRG